MNSTDEHTAESNQAQPVIALRLLKFPERTATPEQQTLEQEWDRATEQFWTLAKSRPTLASIVVKGLSSLIARLLRGEPTENGGA